MNMSISTLTISKNTPYALLIKLKPKEAHAVEALGQLNDRRNRALAAGDRQALLDIAAEYMLIGNYDGCPRLANEIIVEAGRL